MFKRLAIVLICLIMVFVATFGFVVGVVAVPTIYSYAAIINDDNLYEPLRSEHDAVKAFQAYCKSRDLTIEGSIADAVTTFTTGAFNSACNVVGVDITELQAELKAEYDSSGNPVKFLFNTSGIMAMNRVFAQFLQDNELDEGDADVNKNVFSGDMIADSDGNTCLVYEVTSTDFADYNRNKIITYGTYLKYSSDMLTTMNSAQYNIFGNTYTVPIYSSEFGYNFTTNNATYSSPSYWVQADYEYVTSSNAKYVNNAYGYVTVIKRANAVGAYNYYLAKISLGHFVRYFSNGNLQSDDLTASCSLISTFNSNPSNLTTNININIVSNQINNNNYEGDTYITNEGDVIQEPDPVVPGGNDPGWNIGGGEGTATDGNGNTWNITFPDFELPDLNIDWSIQGLGEKFPFSIPFDIVALVTVLNAEPEAPRFEGTVNFGFTTWDYDINLEQFDSVASACRIAELLLLVFGLILITRSIIKG